MIHRHTKKIWLPLKSGQEQELPARNNRNELEPGKTSGLGARLWHTSKKKWSSEKTTVKLFVVKTDFCDLFRDVAKHELDSHFAKQSQP